MANLFGVMAVVLFVSVCFWNVVSVVVLPILICAIAYGVALAFGHVEPSLNKKQNIVVVVAATLFFLTAIYFSFGFSPDVANGEHFRNYVPFLNVSFR